MTASAAAPAEVLHSLPGRVRIHLPGWGGGDAASLEDGLAREPGVSRVEARALTRNVLVRFDPAATDVDRLLRRAAVLAARGGPPDAGGAGSPSRTTGRRGRTSHVLDPGPVVQGVVRVVVTGVGLGGLVVSTLVRVRGPSPGAVHAAALLSVAHGTPALRRQARDTLGRDAADLALAVPRAVALAFAGRPLGLAVAGADALFFLLSVRAQRKAWRAFEARTGAASPGGSRVLEPGAALPVPARVREGTGIALGPDGLALPAAPDGVLPAGAVLVSGRLSAVPEPCTPFVRKPPSIPPPRDLYTRYLDTVAALPAVYAVVNALRLRSAERLLASLLLLNPTAALTGAGVAESLAALRVVRSGGVVTGTRRDRPIRLPHVLLVDGTRPLAEGLETAGAAPVDGGMREEEVRALAAGISLACGSPWGDAFRGAAPVAAEDGSFDGRAATAFVEGVRWSLAPVDDPGGLPAVLRERFGGAYLLRLRRDRDGRTPGVVALRPRPAPGAAELVRACRRLGVEVQVLERGDPAASASFSRRLGLRTVQGSADGVLLRFRRMGRRAAFLSDCADRGDAFEACDLAVGLVRGAGPACPGPDVLVFDPGAVAAVLEAGAGYARAVKDSVLLSVAATLGGVVWEVRSPPPVERASALVDAAGLAAIADDWVRLRGAGASTPATLRLSDPRPERWGEQDPGSVLRAFGTTARGLTGAEAASRRRGEDEAAGPHPFLHALADNAGSPLTGMYALATAITLAQGNRLDAAVMGMTLLANVFVGAWQEFQVGHVSEALRRRGSPNARVLRGGVPAAVPAGEIVPGDVLLVAAGDRLAADARVLDAHGLEVDEAALTGESVPVAKVREGKTEHHRVLLEGSDVVVGHGTAVVVAVGSGTRLGATVAALQAEERTGSPLSERLGRIFRQVLPVAAAGGAAITVGGILRGRPPAAQVVTGVSTVLAALPEALPVLAGMGQAAAARRLERQGARVRRPAAVEALGRVDVACVDKTGTLTEGRLVLRVVATCDREAVLPGRLSPRLRRVLLSAALASPHPEAGDAAAHPTDVAVVRGAMEAGLEDEVRATRDAEVRFDPARAFHVALVDGRVCVKGAPEAVLPRCGWWHGRRGRRRLRPDDLRDLLARARDLGARGLRVIVVAEGGADTPVDDPHGLVALGFLGISDPLRPAVPDAVRRCHEAGIRVIMLTGDHPETARSIAREAGLRGTDDGLLTGTEVARLPDAELDALLERATVVARATPLDKLRIIDSLRRRGHTIAMTGDGVNDAPALRLADVGVAMGRGGTEVARQAADVVLADDDFASLVEALVEGRSFWRNLRRSLGLLLGGNLGEVVFLVGGTILGMGSALTVRQILAINLITDALPAFAVVAQSPEHRRLAGLDREGSASLGRPLRGEILRRAVGTAVPALAASLVSLRAGSEVRARSVGFASIVTTQLALTVEAGRSQGRLAPAVAGAVLGSGGVLLALLTVPPLRAFFELETPSPADWLLIGGSTLLAPLAGGALGRSGWNGSERGAAEGPVA